MCVQQTYILIQDQQVVKNFFFYKYRIEGSTLTLTHVSILLRGVCSPDFAYS